MGENSWAFKSKDSIKSSPSAVDIIRRRTLQSIMALDSDEKLNDYLMETVNQIAKAHGKQINDFTPKDIKRCVDQIYILIEKLNLQNISLKEITELKSKVEIGGELSTLYTFSKAIAGLSKGNIGYLAWHVSKELSKQRIKRAIIVHICGLLANSLYGGDINKIEFNEPIIDPIFEAMDRSMLELVANQLKIGSLSSKNDDQILKEINKQILSEGKDQSITRAWFPKDAESYLEVLIVVAKKLGVNLNGLSSIEEIETAICVKVFSEIWIKIPEEKRMELAAELKIDGKKVSPEYILSMAGLGAIGIANLGGFATYLAGSMSLSFLAGSLGFSIPFAGYTALSSTLFVAIGPIGVATAALPALFEWLRAKPEKLVGVVITVAICRAKLTAEGRLIDANEKQQMESRSEKFKIILFSGGALILLGIAIILLFLKK